MTTLNTEDQQQKPPSDVVWGLAGIATVLNCPRDRAAYLARSVFSATPSRKSAARGSVAGGSCSPLSTRPERYR